MKLKAFQKVPLSLYKFNFSASALPKQKSSVWVMYRCMNDIPSSSKPEKQIQTLQTNHYSGFMLCLSLFSVIFLLELLHGRASSCPQIAKVVTRKSMISRKQCSLLALGGLLQHLFIQQLGFSYLLGVRFWRQQKKTHRFDPCFHRAEGLAPIQITHEFFFVNCKPSIIT